MWIVPALISLVVVAGADHYIKANQSVEVTMNSFTRLIAYSISGVVIAATWAAYFLL